jgi:hypothetical protein
MPLPRPRCPQPNSNARVRLFYAGDNGFSNDWPAKKAPTVKSEAHMTIRQLVLALALTAISPSVQHSAFAQSQGGGVMQKYVIERDLPGAGKL